MKITKRSTAYDVEHKGRTFYVFVHHPSGTTDLDEYVSVTLPSGKVISDKVTIKRFDIIVPESDIERVLAEALA